MDRQEVNPIKIEEVEGIGPTFAEKPTAAGIATTDALLGRGATETGGSRLAAETGISGRLLLEWVDHADPMRLDGVGSEYADLLEAAGVDSSAELARRNAASLAQTFQELEAAGVTRSGVCRPRRRSAAGSSRPTGWPRSSATTLGSIARRTRPGRATARARRAAWPANGR
jgi:predicted flap endonuclease-1-like 5' DNA nuclease